MPVRFTPDSSKFPNESCGGVNIVITDRSTLNPLKVGIQLMCSLQALFPNDWQTKNLNRLLSSKVVTEAIIAGKSATEIEALWQEPLNSFMTRRNSFLIYQ